LDLVLDTCKRIIIIKEGELAADGETAVILSNEELLNSCGLELPLSIQNCPICGASKDSSFVK
jgi:cobalt/nickel transport system ATP-binding protein